MDVAASAEEAIARLSERPVALVVLDEEMTGLTGSQAAHQIRSRWPEVMTIGLHGTPGADLTRRCLEAGMVATFPKPLTQAVARAMLDVVRKPAESPSHGVSAAPQALIKGLDARTVGELLEAGGEGFFQELMTTFISACDHDVGLVQAEAAAPGPSLATRLERTSRLAHRIKGACHGIGASADAALWEEVEHRGASLQALETEAALQAAKASYVDLRARILAWLASASGPLRHVP